MIQSFRFFLVIILLFMAEGVAAQSLSDLVSTSDNPEAFWSVSVFSEEGEALEQLNADKMIIPASNQKLLTLAAVLDAFGSDYRYRTNIFGKGALNESTWKGDLIMRGSGDPSISGDLYDDNRYYVFEQFSQQLREKGIQRVEGNLIADISLFDEQVYPKGWDWYDFSFYYGVQIGPLSFNNNAVDLEVFAEGEIGDTPRISWFPDNTDYVRFENKQVITHPDIDYDEYYRRGLGDNHIVLASTLPQGYYEEESLSVDDPARFFLDSFKVYLENNGIQVNGDMVITTESVETGTLPVLASHISKSMAELIAWANKESDNFYVEMFIKLLSATKSEQAGSFEDGIFQVRNFLAEQGIDTTYVMMNDGSGMAAGNYTTTNIIADLLVLMQEHPEFSVYYNSLAVSGIDGTLAHRTKGTEIYRKFRGKTGYVTGVRTLSGYLETRSGQQIIVSMAANHYAGKVKPVDRFQEQILQYLYEKY